MKPLTTHEELEDLVGAYALDAVDRDEAEALEAHLATCPRCSAELAAYREVTGLFAYSGQEAPDGLWDRIAARMQESPPELRLDRIRPRMVTPPDATAERRALFDHPRGQIDELSARRRGLPWRWVAPVAAAAAIAIAVLGIEVAKSPSSSVTASGASMAQVRRALAQPGSRKVIMTGPRGSKVTVDAVITAQGVGYVYGEKDLTSLPDDRTYQLWGVVGHGAVSYGLLGTSPHIVEFDAGRGVSELAVTDEVATGVVVSHNQPKVSGTVPPAL
jgi:anti-sigma factor RsiW